MNHGMFILTVIGALLITSGCDKGDPLSPLPAGDVPKATPGVGALPVQVQAHKSESYRRDSDREQRSVYIRGSFTTLSITLAPPPFLKIQITGTGEATHLGRATFVAYPVINFTVPPPFPLSGTQITTAANGDELFASFVGHSTPPDPTGTTYITTTHTVTGGTGRFAGATGTLVGTAVAHQGNPNGTSTLEGTILLKQGDDDGGEDETAAKVESLGSHL
jgi:hypothetical protein